MPLTQVKARFIIESGMYNLSAVLTVSDVYNFTISSTNATVICTSVTAKFEFNRVQNVYVSGMVFQGCRNGAAVQITAATSTAIIGSLFIRNSGGIQISQVTRAIVMGNNFTENSVSCLQVSDSSITINANIFTKNRRNCLQASASTLIIDDGNFTENGNCLHVSSSSVTINDSKFYKCVSFDYRDGGRAIYASNSIILINRSYFSKNVAHRDGGGAIYTQNSNLAIESSEISHNQAIHSDGGAIRQTYDYYYHHANNGLQLNNTILLKTEPIPEEQLQCIMIFSGLREIFSSKLMAQ